MACRPAWKLSANRNRCPTRPPPCEETPMKAMHTSNESAVPSPAAPAPVGRRLGIAFAMPPWFDVPPRAYGGIESLAACLAEALIERGHSLVIVGAVRDGTRAEFRRTYKVAPSERIGESIPEVLHAALSNRHLDELHVDVIHDHSLAGPLTARGRMVPTVVTAHGPVTGEMAGYYRAMSADTSLIAISDSQRRLAPDIRWAGIVYNAVKTADFRFRADKDDYVLFLGRMNPDKGAHLAIDAARAAGRRIVLAGKLSEPDEQAYFDAEV